MGLQPQYDLHYAGVCPSASRRPQNSKKLPKSLFGETRNKIIRTSSICTSTAYEGWVSPFMGLTKKWEASWIGLKTRKQQYVVVSPWGGTQNSRGKFLAVVVVRKSKVIYAHPQHMRVVQHLLRFWQ